MKRLAPAVTPLLLLALLPVAGLPSALAHETDTDYGYVEFEPAPAARFSPEYRIDDGRRIRQFEVALKALGIPAEPQPDFRAFPNAGEVSQEMFLENLRFIDPESALKRYLDLNQTSIDLYRDFFSHLLPAQYREYSVDVRESGPSRDSSALMDRLRQLGRQARAAGNGTGAEPLKGVRIIIDPGHMGNDLWDDFTGKFVEIRNKKKQVVGRVSEGQLTLWTAFLTANALEKLGATVKITRADLAPVSTQDFRTYDHTPYLRQYFYDSLDGWMAKYLHLSEAELRKTVRSFPEAMYLRPKAAKENRLPLFPKDSLNLQKLKTHLFITGEDLEARARQVSDFHPDLTIDIHYDARVNTALQATTNDVEAYVPGNFVARETGSRGMRALAFRHALESRRWSESVNAASIVTQRMSEALGIPQMKIPALMIDGNPVAVKVRDGVYTRNLYITRRNLEGLVVYLECLHYDHTQEFYVLNRKDKTSTYQGLTFKHPSRIQKVANGISQGVLDYFRGLGETPGSLPLEIESTEAPIEIKTEF